MGLLLFYLFLALSISFLCSILESVLLSTPISFLRVKENEGKKAATYMSSYKKDIDKPLSAILSLNTVAHTVGAAGVGAEATQVFGEEYFGWVSAILTILILIFTEIIPKTIGARFWRGLALPSAYILKILIVLTYPLVWISARITRLFSGKHGEKTTSREELSVLAHIGAEEGIFAEKENIIIQNLIRLKHFKASDVMTPRVVVSVANEDMRLEEFMEHRDYLRFSRIPVYSGKEDQITGYVIRQQLLEKVADQQEDLRLKDLRRDIVVVPYMRPILKVWESLLEKKEHLALVVDEYGGMDGIVTMEDIIETLLGFEIIDEKDTVDDMQAYAKERWKRRQEDHESEKKLRKPKPGI